VDADDGAGRIVYHHAMSSLLRARGALVMLLLTACGGGNGNGGNGGNGGGGTESAAVSGITAAHNAARAAVSPPAAAPIPPLTWSDTVAATAQAWANNCHFMHSGGKYGENIYASSGTSTPAQVVDSWVAEKANYDYATNQCKGVCGHYTQVVWAASLRLGCGVAQCTQNSPFGSGNWELWVCNYDPPGNFVGQRPY
jgi:hypothetical protein